MPLLFLGAMGVGLGPIVDARTSAVSGVDYLTFIAPGLLAFMVTQSAAAEALWPVMAGHKWLGFYHATAATSIEATEVFSGYMLWLAAYTAVIAGLFVAAAAVLGGVTSAVRRAGRARRRTRCALLRVPIRRIRDGRARTTSPSVPCCGWS